MEALGLQAISLAPPDFLSDASSTPQGTFPLPGSFYELHSREMLICQSVNLLF